MADAPKERAPRWGTLAPGRPSAPTPARMRWLELRHALGRSKNRAAWLAFFCAVTTYRPEAWQVRAHLARSRHPVLRTNKLIVAGIRTGKTFWSSAESAMLHMVNPGVDHLMIAPTYDQVREVVLPQWEEWMTQMAERGYPLLRKMNSSLLRADLHCGSRVYFRSAEKYHHIRGFEFATVGFDEAEFARYVTDCLSMLIGRLSARTHERQLTGTTTTRGYGGLIEWWNRERERAKRLPAGERDQALSAWWYKRARTFDNPHLTPDFLEGLLGYSRQRFLEEVLAYVFASTARVWPEYSLERHVMPYRYDPELPWVLCADWGYHFPYFAALQYSERHGAWVLFWEWLEDQVKPEAQIVELEQIAKGLGRPPAEAAVDPDDTGMVMALRRLFPACEIHLPDGAADRLVRDNIEAVRLLLDPLHGAPLLLVAAHLVTDDTAHRGAHRTLLSYPWIQKSGEILERMPNKDSRWAHCADGVGYFARRIAKPPNPFSIPRGGGLIDPLDAVLEQLARVGAIPR